MSNKSSKYKDDPRWLMEKQFRQTLNSVNSSLMSMLVLETGRTRFLKCNQRQDGTWFCIFGAYNSVGLPVVAFGAGSSLLQSLQNLGKSISGRKWKVDKYSSDLQPGVLDDRVLDEYTK